MDPIHQRIREELIAAGGRSVVFEVNLRTRQKIPYVN
jgi:hypothetical protein